MPRQETKSRPTPIGSGVPHKRDHQAATIGVCLLNASNEVVAANDEAARLLAYPDPAGEELNPQWSQQVRALATSGPSLRSGSWLGELRSGRRRYLCRATRLTMRGTGPLTICVAIVIERPRTNRGAVSCLSTDFHLTRREAEVVNLLVAGLTNKEIARWLHLSANTVKTLLHTIMIKLDVSTRAGIVGALVPRTE